MELAPSKTTGGKLVLGHDAWAGVSEHGDPPRECSNLFMLFAPIAPCVLVVICTRWPYSRHVLVEVVENLPKARQCT